MNTLSEPIDPCLMVYSKNNRAWSQRKYCQPKQYLSFICSVLKRNSFNDIPSSAHSHTLI